MTDDRELSRQLTDLIRATPGVAEVYTAVPLLEAAAQGVVSLFADADGDALVKIGRDGSELTVLAHIAVRDDQPGPATSRAVSAAVSSYLALRGEKALIEVKVVRFDA